MRNQLALLVAAFAIEAFGGCHNECIVPNFGGGCAQSVRVCDPPSPVDIVQDPLGALREGYVQLGGAVKPVRREIGNALARVSDRLPNLSYDLGGCALFAAIFVVDAYACVAGEIGTTLAGGGGAFSDDPCAIALVSGAFAVKECAGAVRELSSQSLVEALNDPRFAAIVSREAVLQRGDGAAHEIATASNRRRAVRRLLSTSNLPTFDKGGNNGTASCDTYCAGPQWGGLSETGICLSAQRGDNGQDIACDQVPGLLHNAPLRCSCVKATVKVGNNGWATCNQYCEGTQWGGWAGKCVSGFAEGIGPIACDRFVGYPNQVSCGCLKR